MNKQKREPLFHISKRANVSLKTQILVRVIAILLGLVFSSLICLIVYGKSPLDFVRCIIEGNFKPISRVWELLQGTALLLGVSLALIPAFKMKFWNIGAEGQFVMGSMAACVVGILLADLPKIILIPLCFIVAMIAGAVWGAIPGIVKAYSYSLVYFIKADHPEYDWRKCL